jgi:hypothetical protein
MDDWKDRGLGFDAFGRIYEWLEEEYNITKEDLQKWDSVVKPLDLPKPTMMYTTFIHPEGNNNVPM